MDNKFVNKVVQNPKHFTAITFSSKPDIYPSVSQARGQAFVMQMRLVTTYFWSIWVNAKFGWKGDWCNMFWILNQSVQRINCKQYVYHLKLTKQMACWNDSYDSVQPSLIAFFMFCCVYNAIAMSIQMPVATVYLSKDTLVSEWSSGISYSIISGLNISLKYKSPTALKMITRLCPGREVLNSGGMCNQSFLV